MKNLFILFSFICIFSTCSKQSNQNTGNKTSATKVQAAKPNDQKNQAEAAKPMETVDRKQMKSVDQLSKEKMQEYAKSREKRAEARKGNKPTITKEKAQLQGQNLGDAYCKCVHQQADKDICNSIPNGVANFHERYGPEIGKIIMDAFKGASAKCK